MTDKLPVSVHILTFNSATTLKRTLTSVRRCAEILVIDGGSTDGTIEITKEFGATVLEQRPSDKQGTSLTDFSAARNVGLQHAHQPWILALDSDEAASEELMANMEKVTSHTDIPSVFTIPRKYVLPNGSIVDHATTYPNERLYFFHRDAVSGWMKPVHERPRIKPGVPVKKLEGPTLAPLGSIEDYKRKNLRYIKIEREKSHGKGWTHWLKHCLYHTVRSRFIGLLRLAWIWLIPRQGIRLPLRYEFLRFWYGWKLIKETCPLREHAFLRTCAWLFRRMLKQDAIVYNGTTIPPKHLRFGGQHFHDDAAFVRTGEEEAHRLMDQCGLKKGGSIMEIGCGTGRLAIGLLRTIGEEVDYCGIDVNAAAIAWCKRHVEQMHSRYRFMRIDLQNERYNPRGKMMQALWRLPIGDHCIDVIYLYSVFSHMEPRDVNAYLAEFARVLTLRGHIFLTTFIEDNVPDFTVNPEHYQRPWKGALHCTRFSRSFFENMVNAHSFTIDRFDYAAETDGQSGVYLLRRP